MRDEPSDYLVGIRDGAADRARVEVAGFRVVTDPSGGREGRSDPFRNYVCVTAHNEDDAIRQVATGLGWTSWDVADLVVSPAARPCEEY